MTEINKKNNFAQFFIIFLTSFILWFFVSFNLKDKIDSYTIIKPTEQQIQKQIEVNKKDLDLVNFWEVYTLIKDNYYDESTLKKQDLVSWAIKWIVESMWDKHSQYMTKDETKSFNETLSWDFEGIWAVVEKVDAWVVIWNVLKWSPAIKSWVKNGDIVLKANNSELKDLNLVEAVSKIKWPAWSEVILNIFRVWEKDLLNIKVIRDKIKIPSVESKIFDKENIWYIAINMFWETTSNDFHNELKKVEKTDWLIIDLRDNWWGYLMSAVEILSNFIENWKPVVKTKYKNFLKNELYPSMNNWKIYDKKVVILINSNSASASEITAWALRDYDKAILVWEKSYWKWSVQEPFNLNDWSMVKLTIAKWFTPKDRAIDKVWIEPDIKVSFEKEDAEKKYDRQLEEWKKVLKDFIKLWALQLVVDKYNNSSKNKK